MKTSPNDKISALFTCITYLQWYFSRWMPLVAFFTRSDHRPAWVHFPARGVVLGFWGVGCSFSLPAQVYPPLRMWKIQIEKMLLFRLFEGHAKEGLILLFPVFQTWKQWIFSFNNNFWANAPQKNPLLYYLVVIMPFYIRFLQQSFSGDSWKFDMGGTRLY